MVTGRLISPEVSSRHPQSGPGRAAAAGRSVSASAPAELRSSWLLELENGLVAELATIVADHRRGLALPRQRLGSLATAPAADDRRSRVQACNRWLVICHQPAKVPQSPFLIRGAVRRGRLSARSTRRRELGVEFSGDDWKRCGSGSIPGAQSAVCTTTVETAANPTLQVVPTALLCDLRHPAGLNSSTLDAAGGGEDWETRAA